MKKVNRVIREILHRVYERNESFMNQKSLARACEVSLELPHFGSNKRIKISASNLSTPAASPNRQK